MEKGPNDNNDKESMTAIRSFVAEIKEANLALIQANGFLIVIPFLALTILAPSLTKLELLAIATPMVIASIFFALSLGLVVNLGRESMEFEGVMAMELILARYTQEQLKPIDSLLGEGYIDRLRSTVSSYKPKETAFPTGGWAFSLFNYGIVMLVVTLGVIVLILVL